MKTPKIIWNILFMFAIFTLSLSCTDDDKESNNKFEITSESIDLFQNKISIDVPQVGKQHSVSVTTSESVTWKIKITKGRRLHHSNSFRGPERKWRDYYYHTTQ